MRAGSRAFSVLTLALLSCSSVYAAGFTGTVAGPDGAPFRGAFVQAQNAQTKITVSVLTDNSGRYAIKDLPQGDYSLNIRAPGFSAAAKSGLALTTTQAAAQDFKLASGKVAWTDISQYQGQVLFPSAQGNTILKGKDVLVARCFACHAFQTRMASYTRDIDGWRDRVNYMRGAMHFFLDSQQPFTDQNAEDVTQYINLLFGKDSILPPSPADMPAYRSLLRNVSDEALKIVYVEYDIPAKNRMPWSAAQAADGSFWIPYYGAANRIGHLDPKTGAVEEFRVPNLDTAAIHSVVPADDGSVWLTQQGGNRLGRWDPKTKTIAEFKDTYLPGREGVTSGGDKHTLRVDKQGRVWSTGRPFSMFDTKTGKYTKFTDVPTTYGLALDKDGNCWFTEYALNGKVGKVDAKTLKVTKYSLPTEDGRPRRIQVAEDGTIWFAEFGSGMIGRFDPKTEKMTEFALPGPEATPYALGLGKDGRVWYSSEHLDVIGALDPKTGRVVEYPLPRSENTMREFFSDKEGRLWFGSPANNKVGYFTLAN